jgi:hypothetical protein
MTKKMKEPGVRSARAPKAAIITIPDNTASTESETDFQPARIIARRFFLSLDHARVICELASGERS